MSADNGIYILKTLDGYRVAHLQAIENIYWWPSCCSDPDIQEEIDQDGYGGGQYAQEVFYHDKCQNCGRRDPEHECRDKINPIVIFDYFNKCKVFLTEDEAFKEADRIYTEITNDDFCGIVEYGIQKINGLEDCLFPTKEK